MAQSRTLTVTILGDASSLQRSLGSADKSLGGFGSKLQSAGERMSSLGNKLSLGVTLPLLGLGKVAFDAASDLSESLNKVDVVFGKSAAGIKSWSDTAAESLGMSRQQALEAAGTFGNLFTAMEIGQKPAAGMSQQLIQLAADLASFNNADPSDTLEALRSGLVGETEPLRKFGVNLSAARVEAEGMAQGVKKSYNEMTAAQKATLAYSIILKDTKTAQGDFARTSEGAANQQRILAAKFEDTAAEIGERLLPIGMKLLDWGSDLLDKWEDLDSGTQDLIIKIAGLSAAAGPMLKIFGPMVKLSGSLAGGFTKLSTSIASTGTAAAGARGPISGYTGLLAAAGTALAVFAVKAHVDAENAMAALGDEIADAQRVLVEYGAENEKAAEAVQYLNQTTKHADELIRQAAKAHIGYTMRLTGSAEAAESFRNVTDQSNRLTDKQREKIALLIGAVQKFSGQLDATTEAQVKNLLAMGDMSAATELLESKMSKGLKALQAWTRESYRQASGASEAEMKQRAMSAAVEDAGDKARQSAGDAKRLGDAIRQIPANRHVRVSVDLSAARAAVDGFVGALNSIPGTTAPVPGSGPKNNAGPKGPPSNLQRSVAPTVVLQMGDVYTQDSDQFSERVIEAVTRGIRRR